MNEKKHLICLLIEWNVHLPAVVLSSIELNHLYYVVRWIAFSIPVLEKKNDEQIK